MNYLAKILIITGLTILIVGIVLLVFNKFPYVGKLPGDIIIKKKNFTLYFPLATSILISIILSIILYFYRK